MPILMGFAEGWIDLRLKVFVLLVCFLAQSMAWTKTVIILCLNQKHGRPGKIYRTHEAVLKQLVLLPRHRPGGERHKRLYAQVAFTREQSLDATVGAS